MWGVKGVKVILCLSCLIQAKSASQGLSLACGFFFPFFLFQIIKCVLLCRKDIVHLKHDELRLFPYPRMDITKAFKPERALFNNDECLIE